MLKILIIVLAVGIPTILDIVLYREIKAAHKAWNTPDKYKVKFGFGGKGSIAFAPKDESEIGNTTKNWFTKTHAFNLMLGFSIAMVVVAYAGVAIIVELFTGQMGI